MSDTYQSLSHSRWNCKYHVVFVPKRRRKTLYGTIRKALGAIFHELARQKECRILEGHLMPDHVPICLEIPPKHAVASVIGFLSGASRLGPPPSADADGRPPVHARRGPPGAAGGHALGGRALRGHGALGQ